MTPGIIKIEDEEGDLILTIYKHQDGYPDGPHGLGTWLSRFHKQFAGIVDGIPVVDPARERIANGMGCYAAQLIQDLKAETGVGGAYIVSPDSWEGNYVYTIYPRRVEDLNPLLTETRIYLYVTTSNESEVLYDGPLSDYDPDA